MKLLLKLIYPCLFCLFFISCSNSSNEEAEEVEEIEDNNSKNLTNATYGDALADRVTAGDGAGIDGTFRNSGVIIDEVANAYYAVNGVHPINSGNYSSYYPKSIVKASLETDEIIEYWAFSANTVGRQVDMEGLTFAGTDKTKLYIGDEYNYIYELDLTSGNITREWDINSIVSSQYNNNSIPTDKGIEAITYADGYFYVGIQQTGYIHKLELNLNSTNSNDANYQKVTEVSSFDAGISPSGLFAATDGTLYMVAVGGTGGSQYIYNFSTTGTLNCTMTLSSDLNIARSDGIFIDAAGEYVYITDSQGPLYNGYSMHRIPWTPDSCN